MYSECIRIAINVRTSILPESVRGGFKRRWHNKLTDGRKAGQASKSSTFKSMLELVD